MRIEDVREDVGGRARERGREGERDRTWRKRVMKRGQCVFAKTMGEDGLKTDDEENLSRSSTPHLSSQGKGDFMEGKFHYT